MDDDAFGGAGQSCVADDWPVQVELARQVANRLGEVEFAYRPWPEQQ
jgi:hypothetical protein